MAGKTRCAFDNEDTYVLHEKERATRYRLHTSYLELLTELVFFGWYRSVFLGIYHTDTEGKLGQYFRYRRYEKVRIYSKMTSARRTTALAAPKEVFAFLAESGTYNSANIMILNKTPRPPPPKDSARQQHEKQMLPRAQSLLAHSPGAGWQNSDVSDVHSSW